jgi:carbonic anhydrase/acetyltransferase-like protein (isoleucine patch superfamily)
VLSKTPIHFRSKNDDGPRLRGHSVIVHSATIEDGSLIGMGSILLNDARIGRACLVGAGALVTERNIFGDGKLILGTPARAVRDLNVEEKKQLQLSADAYVTNYKRYQAGFFCLIGSGA